MEGWIEWRALSASAEGNLGKPAIHTEEGWRIDLGQSSEAWRDLPRADLMPNAPKALRRAIVKFSKLVKGLDRLKKPSEILFRGLEGLEGWKLRKSQALSWQG
jgi:hypothetical protein